MSGCNVDGCDRKSHRKGYCSMHYLRLRRNGTTDRVRKVGRDQCTVDGCVNDQAAHGLCNKHYSRKLRTGDPEGVITTVTGEPHRYFEEVVLTYDGDDCLEWPYSRHLKGYGHLWDSEKGRNDGVHRLVCRHFYGEPPNEKSHAAHSCGNPSCCNHKHLRWATPSENNQDKKGHKTWQGGEANGRSKLTEDNVRKIRKLLTTGLSQAKIAEQFGVTQRVIWGILHGKTWNHVT